MSRPVITSAYWFNSSSGRGTYETLHYLDGTTTCNCPGWTRRVDKQGQRSCKHTRMLQAGITFAQRMAANYTVYGLSGPPSNVQHTIPTITPKKPTANIQPPRGGQRKFTD